MKIKPNTLSQWFKWIRKSPVDDLVKASAKSSVDDLALGALDAMDDVPAENIVKNLDLFDNSVPLGNSYLLSDPFQGSAYGDMYSANLDTAIKNLSTEELAKDALGVTRAAGNSFPSFPSQELVISSPLKDNPHFITARPHKNTALGRWFQNQTGQVKPFEPDRPPVSPKEFTEGYAQRRLAQRNGELYGLTLLDDILDTRYNRFNTHRPEAPVDFYDYELPF